MKAVILNDNYVQNRYDLQGEPGFSCYIEHKDIRLLFDLGKTKTPFDNARKIGIDLSKINYIVLSHGHLDHTWGLETFLKRYKVDKRIKFVCHPDALLPKKYKQYKIGIRKTEKELEGIFHIIRTTEPLWMNEDIVFLGEIKRVSEFENQNPSAKTKKNGKYVDDYVLDDSAIVYKRHDGIVLITGCSHSGICNIVERAKEVTKKKRIIAMIGGFHLLNEERNEVGEKTIQYLGKQEIDIIYPCHCTNLQNKMWIGEKLNVGEVGVGTEFEY